MSIKKTFFIFTPFFFIITAYIQISTNPKHTTEKNTISATALYETSPMPHGKADDSADDPAIWINRKKTAESKIIGTDKLGGLTVYNLHGEELFYYPHGNMNNVDIRYDFILGNDTIDLVCSSNLSNKSIAIYKISEDGRLTDIASGTIQSKMNGNVYGFCMYKSPVTGTIYAFVNSIRGEVEQWELIPNSKNISASLVRSFALGTQIEGMVADDENQNLFIAEERSGIWKFDAEPNAVALGEKIVKNTGSENNNAQSDQEGLAIYYLPGNAGYLIVSNQGDNNFNIYEKNTPHNYLGSFRIVDGVVDGAEETDGVEIYSYALNQDFQHGLLVVQDGQNYEGNNLIAQNFKLVPWENIARLFNDALEEN